MNKPILTLDIIKKKMGSCRHERRITSMNTFKEIFDVPEGAVPMKEWCAYGFHPHKPEVCIFLGFFYAEESCDAEVEAYEEAHEDGLVYSHIEVNHILHYYRDKQDGDLKTILTKEILASYRGEVSNTNRIRSEKEYFKILSKHPLTTA